MATPTLEELTQRIEGLEREVEELKKNEKKNEKEIEKALAKIERLRKLVHSIDEELKVP